MLIYLNCINNTIFNSKNSIIPLGVTIAESDNLIEWKRIEGVGL